LVESISRIGIVDMGGVMKDHCNEAINRALELVRELMILADEGDISREDVGCGVLFGTVRDCAYKIRNLAESEIAEHKKRGKWQQGD